MPRALGARITPIASAVALALALVTSDLVATEAARQVNAGGGAVLNSDGAELDLFVAIFTVPGHAALRRAVRSHWEWPKDGTVAYRFILCSELADKLDQEEQEFQDIMRADCTEGYGKGLLTKKLIAVMRGFQARFGQAKWFFKVDDDTFPRMPRLLSILREQPGDGHVYAGMMYGPGLPERQKGHKWEEPADVFPSDHYPKSAAGGTGYVLDANLVRYILANHVAEENLLWNEDKAVAVWVDKAIHNGRHVRYVDVQGTDGYDGRHVCSADHGGVSWTLIHKVNAENMKCLRDSGTVRRKGCGCP